MTFIRGGHNLWCVAVGSLLLGMTSVIVAETTIESDESASTNSILTIEPKHCVLQSADDVCQTQVTIRWTYNQPRNYCLFEQGDDLSLACWEEAVRGATRIRFIGESSVTYELKSDDSTIVSSVTLKVSRILSERRRAKKRRRRFWSFP